MKKLFYLFTFALILFSSIESEAQSRRVYEIEYALISGDTTFNINASQFPEGTNGLVVDALFHNCLAADYTSSVTLYNGAYLNYSSADETSYVVDSDTLGNSLSISNLTFVDGDGTSNYEFAKVAFYKSDLQIRINAAATPSASSGVVIHLWAISEEE